MMFLGSHGYRAIAHDRRGHGVEPAWNGNDMEHLVPDRPSRSL